MLATYCSKPTVYCEHYKSIVSKLSMLIAEARVDDLLYSKDYKGLDAGIFDLIRAIIKLYSLYIAGFLLTADDRIGVRTVRPVVIGKIKAEPGEVLFMPPREALSLILAEYAEPLESNLIRLPIPQTRPGEGEAKR